MGGEREGRRAIEALRFGIVPEDYVDELTIGFEAIRDWAVKQFPHANGRRPRVSQITGPFGTGKSHTMAVVRYLARQEGYVTARVEVDGQYVSLSDPARLLASLWSTLAGDGAASTTPLLDLYLRAIDAGHMSGEIAARGFDRIRDNYAAINRLRRMDRIDDYGDEIDALLSCSDEITAKQVNEMVRRDLHLTWEDFQVKTMVGRKVEERPLDFVESLAGHARVAELAGYKGLIITIDEFEVEQNLAANKLSRVRKLISTLTEYLRGTTSIPPAPLGIFIAAVGQDGHRGDKIINLLTEPTGGQCYEVRPLSKASRRELARRIHGLYGRVYGNGDDFDFQAVNQVEANLKAHQQDSDITRAFIKHYVAQLDSLYGPPREMAG